MKHILIALVKFYRKYISPLTPPTCRYVPTCSQYALEALEKYGALKGGWLAVIPSTRGTIFTTRSPEDHNQMMGVILCHLPQFSDGR